MQSNLHEKIHLNSEDIRFIKNQIDLYVNSRVDVDLPTNSNDDSLKSQVLSNIQEFINESFELARYSLIVDGKDMSLANSLELAEGKQEIEPFDVELNERLRELYTKVDEETLKVTELRRNMSKLASERYEERVEKEEKLFKQILDNVKQQEEQTDASSDPLSITPSEEESLKRIQSKYDTIRSEVTPLQEQLPNTAADLRKVDESIEYLQDI